MKIQTNNHNVEKKVILVFGGSGAMGNILFKRYNKDKYKIINISKTNKLEIEDVLNIKIDITKKIDLLILKFKLKYLIEKVDILVLGSMFIYHKDFWNINKKELLYEYDVNVISQIQVIKLIHEIFWKDDVKENKKCVYISSACSKSFTGRDDLQSYCTQKSNLNNIAKYLDKYLTSYNVSSILYMPGSLGHDNISKEFYNSFWRDVEEIGNKLFIER